MARYEEDEELVDDPEAAEEEEQAPAAGGGFMDSLTGQTPWWIVSIRLHALVITLAGLMSMAIDLGEEEAAVVMVTELAARPDIKEAVEKPKVESAHVLESKHDTPPTDPTSKDPSDIVVP